MAASALRSLVVHRRGRVLVISISSPGAGQVVEYHSGINVAVLYQRIHAGLVDSVLQRA